MERKHSQWKKEERKAYLLDLVGVIPVSHVMTGGGPLDIAVAGRCVGESQAVAPRWVLPGSCQQPRDVVNTKQQACGSVA